MKYYRVKHEDLTNITDFATGVFYKYPSPAKFKGMTRPLTEDERATLSKLEGCLNLLSSKGIDVSSIAIEFYMNDSESID